MTEQRTDMEWLSRYEKLKAEAQGQEVRSKHSRVFRMVKKEAKLGNKYAQKWLGDLYLDVVCDFSKAREWYKKAAEQKNVDAYIALTKESYGWEEKREWYKKAAKAGNIEAQIWMGREWKSIGLYTYFLYV